MKAVAYVRLSQESDTSINSQIEDITAYCEKNNIELVRIFNEGEKVSGWDDNRPQFKEMLSYITSQDVDAVIVRDGSRLGRVSKDRLYWLLHLNHIGVELHTVRGLVDPDNPSELLIESVMAFSDDVVKRAEIERSRKEIEKRKNRGLPLGRPPYGFTYTKDKTHLIPVPEEFKKAVYVITLRDTFFSWSYIVQATGIPMTTCRNIYKNRWRYE